MSAARAALAALAAFVLLAGLPRGVVAQDPGEPDDPAAAPDTTVYRLELIDGSTFFGHVESETEASLVFRTLGGARLEVERSQVRTLEPRHGRVVEGEMWEADPNATRLFFGPTGRALETGEGYVGLFELFFAFGAYGPTDRVVLAGGTPVVPGLAGDIFYLAPKVTVFSGDRLDLAVGALAAFLTQEIDEGSVGVAYAVGTVGTADDAFTAGAGWGFALGGRDASLSDSPVILLGGESRTGRRTKVITENYFAYDNGLIGIVSGGVRLLGERFSADLGVGGGLGETAFCCLPVLSAAYRF